MRVTARRFRALVLSVAVLCAPVLFADTAPKIKAIEPPHQILFIGNSLTYFNGGIHAHLREMVAVGDPDNKGTYFFRASTISGASLSQHAGGFADLIRSRKWDVVILQPRSTEPIEKAQRAAFRAAALHFSSLARETGARTALFVTWAAEDKPEQTEPLCESTTIVGNEIDAFVVPVGLAFERARAGRPGLAVHAPDKLHPSLAGTYLATCVFYGALFGKSPEGVAYTAGLPAEDAVYLQRVAWETVRVFYDRTGR